jgi:hypothetical protein
MVPLCRRGSVMFGTIPKAPRCFNCARPMRLFRQTSRYGALPDVYSFYCCVCDEWHVEEGNAAYPTPTPRLRS